MKYLQNIVIVCLLCVSTFGIFGTHALAEENTPTQETSTTAVEPRVLRSTATCLAILAAGDDVDLSNCDLRNQTVILDEPGVNYRIDFSGADLTNAQIQVSSDASLVTNLHSAIVTGTTLPSSLRTYYSNACNLTGVPSVLPHSSSFVREGAIWSLPNYNGMWHASYSSCNFQDKNLSGMKFEYLDMATTNFTGANVSNTRWYSVYLNNANLTGANFTGAYFVENNDLLNVIGTPTLPAGYRKIGTSIVGAGLILDGIDLTNQNISNMDLSRSRLDYIVLKNTNLNGVKFAKTSLNLRDCGGSTFRNADFSYASLSGDFSSCDLSGVISNSTCFHGTLPDGYIHASGQSRCMSGVWAGFIIGPDLNLSYRDISGISFAGADLTNVDFRGSNLSYANFDDMTLTNVDLTDAIMVGTSLVGADLRTASILGLRTGNLVGTPLVPSGYAIRRQHIVGPQVNLFGARLQSLDLSNLDLSDANLSGANLTGANLSNTDLSGANMVRANATNANLSRTELLRANLSRANLTGADLSQSNLEDTDLAGVTVTNARFANAVLHGVKSGRIVGTPASLPNDYAIRDGYFVGTQANLTNAVLTDVNLNGINLSRATLNGLKSRNVIGAPILPSRYRVVKGYVVGPNVNLAGADLTNQSLMNVQLIGADLRNSKLINANFAGTNITNAMFRGADMTRIRSGRMVGTPASLPTGYIIRNGTFVKQ